ncbi:MAG: penicillin acylase family protein [Desulfobacterales bacterium]|nr:MAG: penicillin acylase family protein [Desulfobacterales bacterium]
MDITKRIDKGYNISVRQKLLAILFMALIAFALMLLPSIGEAKGKHHKHYKHKKPSVTYEVSGLEDPAEILVDKWGVPHLFANKLYDTFFVQGFNAARDRLWQIDLWRKRGLGLLSGTFGSSFIEKDRAARLFLYRGDMYTEWLAYGSDAKRISQAYVKGVNEYIKLVKQNPDLMPWEFEFLNYEPDFWSPEDVVRMRSHGLVRNVRNEVTRALLVRDYGLEVDKVRRRLEPPWETEIPDGLDLSLIPEDVLDVYNLATGGVVFTSDMLAAAASHDPKNLREFVTRKLLEVQPREEAGIGSNNWAISPSLTSTGRPILENDPHRSQTVPSLRYIAHLVAPGLNVIGAGEPGLPGISIGHNERVAFGLTIFSIDQEDLYVYETNGSNEYRYKDHWEPMEIVTETIPVYGSDPVSVELKFTRHGPVIYEYDNVAFAVRAAWLEPGMAPYFGSIEYMRAQSWDQFLAAMNRWGAPSENQVYADVDGNIGWKPGGRAPIRPNWDGLMPVPGDGRYEWAGFWDMDQLPVEHNPERGWVATANNMNLFGATENGFQTPNPYPYEERKLGFEWSNPNRIQRINEVLSAASKVTLKDMWDLKNDYVTMEGLRIVTVLREEELVSPDLKVSKALQILTSWDAVLDADSTAAAIFQRWWRNGYLRRAIRDRMVTVPPEARQAVGSGDYLVMIELIENPDGRLGPNPVEARNEAILASLLEAVTYLENLLGPDMEKWTYGAVHTRSYTHQLSDLVDEETRELIDVGPPYPRGGGSGSVGADGASWGMVLDVGKWDHSIAISTPGQSGDPYSPHYDDLFPIWAENQSFPLLYSEGRVKAATEQIIRLKPSGD